MASRPVISTSVAVHLHRDGRVFFLPYSKTENGFSVFDGLPEVVNAMEDAAELGRSLEAAMARSFARVLPAVDFRAPDNDDEILVWMKKTSWCQYSRGVRSVSITVSSEFPEETLDLRPLQNKGAREIDGATLTQRVLHVAIPEGATADQLAVFKEMAQYAEEHGVRFVLEVIP